MVGSKQQLIWPNKQWSVELESLKGSFSCKRKNCALVRLKYRLFLKGQAILVPQRDRFYHKLCDLPLNNERNGNEIRKNRTLEKVEKETPEELERLKRYESAKTEA